MTLEDKEEKLPGTSALLNVEQAIEYLASHKAPVDEQWLRECAESGHIPHFTWRFSDQEVGPFFAKNPLLKWVKRNCLASCAGRDFPARLVVRVMATEETAVPWLSLPSQLRSLEGHLFDVESGRLVGVYFLISGDRVMYVGQSTNVLSRVSTYASTPPGIADKTDVLASPIEKVIYLPVPASALADVEAAFISVLKSPWNGVRPSRVKGREQEVIDAVIPNRKPSEELEGKL